MESGGELDPQPKVADRVAQQNVRFSPLKSPIPATVYGPPGEPTNALAVIASGVESAPDEGSTFSFTIPLRSGATTLLNPSAETEGSAVSPRQNFTSPS